jgi:hypothetical protein
MSPCNDGRTVTTQAALWTSAGTALTVAVGAGLMDWRRHRRPDFDAVGWMPWRGIQVTAFFAALAFVVLAIRP